MKSSNISSGGSERQKFKKDPPDELRQSGSCGESTAKLTGGNLSDGKVTLKKNGCRIDPTGFMGRISLFEGLATKYTAEFALLRQLVSNTATADVNQIQDAFDMSGILDENGHLKEEVRALFQATLQLSPQGEISFDRKPFAPANDDERIALLRETSRVDQRQAGLLRTIFGAGDDEPRGL